ncbi:MAG: DNA mismatch repair endonuclease MutL [Bacteroidales bacterium]|nr:DNA mismatch repair endonuclease MutL [Bacteroidales bacterium]
MGKLKVLPAGLANLIAAGEVVQRPASVVKELMENAVDAGADNISVIVTDAGRTLIQVIDNGCGMNRTDAVLCFDRHATSKISEAEDLNRIVTLGFRGEALPSISAVGEITLKTRKADSETGTQVKTGGMNGFSVSECACPAGSNFEVRNLFYNTPARRKFLKTDNVELKHIVEEFTRIALSRPETAFSLRSNGKDLFVLRKAKSRKFRILDLMGSSVASDIVDLEIKTSTVNVSGYVGRPDTARKTGGNQYLFVNGRYFRSAYLHKAVMKAYEELIPDGYSPQYFIFLEVDPLSIDVNIHPTKAEVKFEDEQIVFQTLYASIREVLGRNSFGGSLDFEADGAVSLPQLGKSFEAYRGAMQAPSAVHDESFNPFHSHDVPPESGGEPSPNFNFASSVDRRDDYGKLFEQKMMPSSRMMVMNGKYILTAVPSGLMVVNIRRATERICYERALKALSKGAHVTQTAMFPVSVQVGVQNRLLLDDNAGTLARLGFELENSGEDTVIVNGVPEGYSCESGKIVNLVSDICSILSDGTSAIDEVLQSSMAHKFAILGASNAETVRNSEQAQSILDTLFACENPETTSDGRRIAAIIPEEDFEKRF